MIKHIIKHKFQIRKTDFFGEPVYVCFKILYILNIPVREEILASCFSYHEAMSFVELACKQNKLKPSTQQYNVSNKDTIIYTSEE
jgi:hypothetical protein